MIIEDVKFSYIDRKYRLGPYIEFFRELDVPSYDYDDIVKVIQDSHPEYDKVKVIRYRKK